MTEQLGLFGGGGSGGYRSTKRRNAMARRERKVLAEADCELCGRHHTWYESILEWNMREEIRDLYRRTCNGCRKRYMTAIKGHRLDTETALRLMTTLDCDLCHQRFSTNNQGRRNAHVDHDHTCCPNEKSCGQCIRGIVCPRCNTTVGSVEHMLASIGLDKLIAYLDYRNTERGDYA